MSEPALPQTASRPVRLAVIWIDWYAYHVARFRGLLSTPALAGHTVGIELVGGVGVHAGLKFREPLPSELPIITLFPASGWSTVSHWTIARRLWRTLTELDPECVLVPGYYTLPGIAAAFWARTHRRQSVLMSESTAYDHARSAWKEWIKGLLIRSLFSSAVTGGTAHSRYLRQMNFPADRIRRFYDVVDNAGIRTATEAIRRTQTPSAYGLPDRPYFLYVGRLAAEKNVTTLLQAWRIYRENGGDWPLVLAGDGPARHELEQEIAAGEADVLFTGLRSSSELQPIYAFAGCFVLPSSREPWGLVVNEAMAAGLPVLVSNRCGSSEDLVQEGQNGFTFAPQDVSGLTRLLVLVASFTLTKRRELGARSSELVSAYSPQAFGNEIAGVMTE